MTASPEDPMEIVTGDQAPTLEHTEAVRLPFAIFSTQLIALGLATTS